MVTGLEVYNMTNYKITFLGRLKGAIGICYTITDYREAESEEKAILALYDKYDHVHMPKVERA